MGLTKNEDRILSQGEGYNSVKQEHWVSTVVLCTHMHTYTHNEDATFDENVTIKDINWTVVTR